MLIILKRYSKGGEALMRGNKNGKGRGWFGDPEGHAQAGRLGGETTALTKGESFYQQIGRKGGQKRGRSKQKRSIQ